jgi:hypothetical protein
LTTRQVTPGSGALEDSGVPVATAEPDDVRLPTALSWAGDPGTGDPGAVGVSAVGVKSVGGTPRVPTVVVVGAPIAADEVGCTCGLVWGLGLVVAPGAGQTGSI